MIRVISSPSSSTTGLATLIFAIEPSLCGAKRGEGDVGYRGVRRRAPRRGRILLGWRRYSIARAGVKGATFAARRHLCRLVEARYHAGNALSLPIWQRSGRDLEAMMPGAGTDKTKAWAAASGPIIIL